MREVLSIEAKWLVDAAPTFFKIADPNILSKRKKLEKIEPMFKRGEAKDEWRISKFQIPEYDQNKF